MDLLDQLPANAIDELSKYKNEQNLQPPLEI